MFKCISVTIGIVLCSTAAFAQQQVSPEDSPTPQELTAAVRQQLGETVFLNSSLQAQVGHLSSIVAKLRAENDKLKATQPTTEKSPH